MKSMLQSILPFALMCAVVSPAAAREAVDRDTMQRLRAATVQVSVEYGSPFENKTSWGTGFVVGDGLVMTNAHIVSDKIPTRVYIHNEFLPQTEARVIAFQYDTNGFDKGDIVEYIANALVANAEIGAVTLSNTSTNYDVALLAFTPRPEARLPVLSFARQAAPNESVFAIGYPGSDRPAPPRRQQYASGPGSGPATPVTVTAGRVRQVLEGDPQLVMHDALSKFGNSGGPVVNARGEVVGMQTWSMEPDRRGVVTSFALSGTDLSGFLEQYGRGPIMYGRGAAFRRNRGEGRDARAFVLRAAEAGDADYLALAGLLSFLGDCGFARDPNAAAYYLQQAMAIAPRSPNAYLYQAGLAAVQVASPAVRSNYRADQLLRAANNSQAVGKNSRHPDYRLLAFESSLYMQGGAAGFPYDPNRALTLAEKAMEGAFAIPLALTGFHYYFGDAYAGRDHGMALEHAREAARNGIPEGMALLAYLYYDSDVIAKTPANLQTARTLAQYAADMGEPWALGLLANICYDSGNPQERSQAYALATRGANCDNRFALYCLGRIAWDAFLANPGDLAMAAKAWSLVDAAEHKGVRIALPGWAGRTAAVTSAKDMLSGFAPDVQQWLLAAGKREQQAPSRGNGAFGNP